VFQMVRLQQTRARVLLLHPNSYVGFHAFSSSLRPCGPFLVSKTTTPCFQGVSTGVGMQCWKTYFFDFAGSADAILARLARSTRRLSSLFSLRAPRRKPKSNRPRRRRKDALYSYSEWPPCGQWPPCTQVNRGNAGTMSEAHF
jgi:hypothetical protein